MAVSRKFPSPANAPALPKEGLGRRHQLPGSPDPPPASHPTLIVGGILLLAVGLVFVQTADFKFVNYDDEQYVYNNPSVARGLTAEGITWAFSHIHAGYWTPLTWLSLMLDCQIYGLSAGGHHLSNALLHAATVILLFLVLWRMTGDFWPSALAAAIFAVHPLRVESVAWVTERKDVLSGVFFVLALGAYVSYVRHPFSVARYLAIMVLLALGLMAKPILVTLPLVLLLLDCWPLGRFSSNSLRHPTPPDGRQSLDQTPPHCKGRDFAGRANFWAAALRRFPLLCLLVMEKLPLLLLAAIFCGVTFWTQADARAVNETLPLGWRFGNALVSYVSYLGQSVYPLGMAVFYPHPRSNLPIGQVCVAVAVLALISAAGVACRRRCPYLLMGWLWYLGMLVPVIGLVQAGGQARGDRFTYLPQIGLCIALAWAAGDLCRFSWCRRWACGLTAALVLAVLTGCAWRQTCFWRDSETLWNHALACTSQNDLAHGKLGLALAGRGQLDAAIAQYRRALEIEPYNIEVRNNLAVALSALGRFDEAMTHCQEVLKSFPDDAAAQFNLALALTCRGRLGEAIVHYRKGLETQPGDVRARCYLGAALVRCGRFDESIAQFEQAVQLKPDDVDAQTNLARLRANCPVASLRDGAAAIEHGQRAVQLSGGRRAEAFDVLAAAYAEAGRFPEALAAAHKALELARQQNIPTLIDVERSRIALYEAGKPLRQKLPAATPSH